MANFAFSFLAIVLNDSSFKYFSSLNYYWSFRS